MNGLFPNLYLSVYMYLQQSREWKKRNRQILYRARTVEREKLRLYGTLILQLKNGGRRKKRKEGFFIFVREYRIQPPPHKQSIRLKRQFCPVRCNAKVIYILRRNHRIKYTILSQGADWIRNVTDFSEEFKSLLHYAVLGKTDGLSEVTVFPMTV